MIGQVQSGDLRAIGYAGSTPLAELPSAPLISSLAPGFRLAEPWAGLLAPAKTPDFATMILSNALKRASENVQYKTALQAGGYTPASNSGSRPTSRRPQTSARCYTVTTWERRGSRKEGKRVYVRFSPVVRGPVFDKPTGTES